jgi:hypothetical protein
MPLAVTGRNGAPKDPGAAVTPIFLENDVRGVFQVIGTGFFITRYGLLLTAKHVAEEIADSSGTGLQRAYAWHLPDERSLVLRPIIDITFDRRAPFHFPDIAVCQADNFLKRTPDNTLINERIALHSITPAVGAPVGTYAYPENWELDLRSTADNAAVLKAGLYEGRLIAVVRPDEYQLRYRHYRASMRVLEGASGGPAFSGTGGAFAVNCKEMTYLDGEYDSRLVPIEGFLHMEIPVDAVPPWSAEYAAIPVARRGQLLTGRELVRYGHVEFVSYC